VKNVGHEGHSMKYEHDMEAHSMSEVLQATVQFILERTECAGKL